eukprot:5485885-Alexandrium_andersonii.AAC.1
MWSPQVGPTDFQSALVAVLAKRLQRVVRARSSDSQTASAFEDSHSRAWEPSPQAAPCKTKFVPAHMWNQTRARLPECTLQQLSSRR